MAFARSKEGWIRQHLDARGADVAMQPGAQFPLGGQMLTVASGAGRRVTIEDNSIHVPGPADRVPKRLGAYLREVARDRITGACDDYAARLGRSYTRLALRDTRSRWGSCTSDGRLMFSWRLIMAPPEVLNYVAAHEVAHLAQMNHSAAFWTEVERIYGDYKKPRLWLKKNGNDLHRYRFD